MQSKKHTHYEVVVNQVSGQVIGWLLVYFVFPLMGVETTAIQATASSVMFFISSYTRTYTIRRIFNKIGRNMRTEDDEFEALEEKIGATTIDIRQVMHEKRKWFMESEGWMADDETVKKAWGRRND